MLKCTSVLQIVKIGLCTVISSNSELRKKKLRIRFQTRYEKLHFLRTVLGRVMLEIDEVVGAIAAVEAEIRGVKADIASVTGGRDWRSLDEDEKARFGRLENKEAALQAQKAALQTQKNILLQQQLLPAVAEGNLLPLHHVSASFKTDELSLIT